MLAITGVLFRASMGLEAAKTGSTLAIDAAQKVTTTAIRTALRAWLNRNSAFDRNNMRIKYDDSEKTG